MVTAGFSEVGNHDLEQQVHHILKKYNMRMVGPNCLGTLDTYSNFDNLFLPRSRLTRPKPGVISFICQSGAVGSATLDLLAKEGMKFAKFVSYGNALDVDESDMLEYLGNDPQTKIICMYVEGIKDGKKFMRIAKKVAEKETHHRHQRRRHSGRSQGNIITYSFISRRISNLQSSIQAM